MFRSFWSPHLAGGYKWFADKDAAALEALCNQAGRTDCFASLNVYPDPFKPGHLYDFGFDFDGDHAVNDAQQVLDYLNQRVDAVVTAHLSGVKGVHLLLPYEAVGLPLSDDNGAVCKEFQAQLATELQLTSLDWKIHNKRRMWRVPGTKHKSGEVKTALHLQVGPAAGPRPSTLLPLLSSARGAVSARPDRSLHPVNPLPPGFTPLCMEELVQFPGMVAARNQGNRNELTLLAATYMRQTGASVEEATLTLEGHWLDALMPFSSSSETAARASTRTCVKSVYERGLDFSCGNARSKGCACCQYCPLWRPVENTNRRGLRA